MIACGLCSLVSCSSAPLNFRIFPVSLGRLVFISPVACCIGWHSSEEFFFLSWHFLMKYCLNLGEHLSVVRVGGFQVCLSFYILPHELRVARFSVSGCSWKLLASHFFSCSFDLLVWLWLFCQSWDSFQGMTRFLMLGVTAEGISQKHEFYSMGGTWRGGWAPVDQRAERGKAEAGCPSPRWVDLLCFGCGL